MENITNVDKLRIRDVEQGLESNKILVIDSNNVVRWVDAIGSDLFDKDIKVALSNNKTFGKYLNGETIPAEGLTAIDVIRMAAIETIYPTFTNPSLTLTSSVAGYKEVGESFNVALTANFNRGAILGKIVNGTWNPSTQQNPRAGEATEYLFDNISNGTSNTKTISNYVTKLGSNSFSAKVEYAEGPQPKDSEGGDYNSKLSAGDVSRSISYTGVYRRFWGPSSDNDITTSAGIRALPQTALDNASTTFILNTGATYRNFYISIPEHRSLAEVVNLNTNANITSGFTLTPMSVDDAGGTPRGYKRYKMTNATPFSANQEFQVKIV